MLSQKQLKLFSFKNIIISTGLISFLLIITACGFNNKVITFRKIFDVGGDKINNDLEKHVMEGVKTINDIVYFPGDKDAKLDIYYPIDVSEDKPVIFWIHGGGWIAGNKSQVGNYMKILANKGYVAIAIDYSLAPKFHHPTPVRQAIQALTFLTTHAEKYKFNKKKIVIAGDSGGAQIATQTAIVIANPKYAKILGIEHKIPIDHISAMILHCGPYDFSRAEEGKEGPVLRMMLRAYSGHRNYKSDKMFNLGSVINHIPESFPKTFISVGNSDMLQDHSYVMADTLIKKGVSVDSLFWRNNKEVSLNHEYQFNLDESGKLALERTITFLEKLQNKK